MEMKFMGRDELETWIISIENSASIVKAKVGPSVVDFVFMKYGGESVEELDPYDLQDVFSELYAIEADL